METIFPCSFEILPKRSAYRHVGDNNTLQLSMLFLQSLAKKGD